MEQNNIRIRTPRISTGTSICTCGGRKQCWAKQCQKCAWESRKPPSDPTVYIIQGVPCRRIPLTKNRYTLVWESDYALLSQWSWHAVWSESAQDYYAARGGAAGETLKTIMLARALMQPAKELEVDHWNHLTLDNRRSNLRVLANYENSCNRRRKVTNTSGHSGVSWHKVAGKWFAFITVRGERINLGYYDLFEDAHSARKNAEVVYHGDFSYAASVIEDELRKQIMSLSLYTPKR